MLGSIIIKFVIKQDLRLNELLDLQLDGYSSLRFMHRRKYQVGLLVTFLGMNKIIEKK